jgi:hypothetical protein
MKGYSSFFPWLSIALATSETAFQRRPHVRVGFVGLAEHGLVDLDGAISPRDKARPDLMEVVRLD